MAILFDAEFPEPSSRVGFAQNIVESGSESRDENTLATALVRPDAGFHLFCGPKAIIRRGDDPAATFTRAQAAAFAPRLDEAVLLGTAGGSPRIAAPVDSTEDAIAEPFRLYDLRSLLYSSAVSDADASAIARAASLLHWHAVNRFCGRCGAASASRIGGYRRDCDSCGLKIFPRTDPVVIMLAVRAEHCLLGRSPHFPPGWYSTLAGFVEPGETIEAAVRRETAEESGIRVGRVRYHASQPWPFPHSLMIGAFGEAISSQIRFDDRELEDCRWFSRADVAAMVRDAHPAGYKCPPTRAIAHALIRAWLDG